MREIAPAFKVVVVFPVADPPSPALSPVPMQLPPVQPAPLVASVVLVLSAPFPELVAAVLPPEPPAVPFAPGLDPLTPAVPVLEAGSK
jgi:hypothetical protein